MKLNKLFKRIILILMCFGLVAGGSFGYLSMEMNRKVSLPENTEIAHTPPSPKKNPMNWQIYSPSDQRFNVQFPSNPKEGSEEMIIANTRFPYYKFSSEMKGSLYAVSYVDFPSRWKFLGANKLLTKSFDMFVKNEQNVEEILQQEITTHNGLPALVYRLKQERKEIQGKFIISGNTLYRVAVTYPLAAVSESKPEHFLESFQLNS